MEKSIASHGNRVPDWYDEIDYDEVIAVGRVLDEHDVKALKALRDLNAERFDALAAVTELLRDIHLELAPRHPGLLDRIDAALGALKASASPSR
jgi:hypothetical protein